MTTEERDVPELTDLVGEIVVLQQRCDQTVATYKDNPEALAQGLSAFVQNDLLSWLRDFAESVALTVEDMQDEMAPPVEISRDDADLIGELLLAQQSSSVGNPEVLAKIAHALSAVTPEDDDAEGEDDEGES